jgi:hypothetical protein
MKVVGEPFTFLGKDYGVCTSYDPDTQILEVTIKPDMEERLRGMVNGIKSWSVSARV